MSADVSGISKRFVSESDIEAAKKKRQEDWERVRKPDQPLEAPEEEYDSRSLFERLEEQRVKKQEEWDESHRLKNMVRGLENDEVEFLDFVARRQEQLEHEKNMEEQLLLAEYKSATLPALVTTSLSNRPSTKVLPQHKSQKSLLAGVVKRKNSDCSRTEEPKQMRLGNEGIGVSQPADTADDTAASGEAAAGISVSAVPSASADGAPATAGGSRAVPPAVAAAGERRPPAGGSNDVPSSQTAADGIRQRVFLSNCCSVVAILPGIGDYEENSDDDSSTSSTSSDGDLDDLLYPSKPKVIKRGGNGGGDDENG